jgi:ribosomal protein S18 acetylase RimI-like enzyme
MPEIRDAREDELDEVADVISAAYAQYGPPQGSVGALVDAFDEYRVEQRDVRSRLADSQLIVAVDDGRIAGTVTFYPPGSEKKGEGWPLEWAAIRLLAVHPDVRGRGLGRSLTDECVRRACALGAPTVGLHTAHIMAVAQAMYERMGFIRYPENDFPITDDFVVVAYTLAL